MKIDRMMSEILERGYVQKVELTTMKPPRQNLWQTSIVAINGNAVHIVGFDAKYTLKAARDRIYSVYMMGLDHE